MPFSMGYEPDKMVVSSLIKEYTHTKGEMCPSTLYGAEERCVMQLSLAICDIKDKKDSNEILTDLEAQALELATSGTGIPLNFVCDDLVPAARLRQLPLKLAELVSKVPGGAPPRPRGCTRLPFVFPRTCSLSCVCKMAIFTHAHSLSRTHPSTPTHLPSVRWLHTTSPALRSGRRTSTPPSTAWLTSSHTTETS